MSIVASKLRLRKSFGKTIGAFQIPNLIELQKRSYENFLQKDVEPDKRAKQGLHAVFHSVFPISDYKQTVSLEFVKYTLHHPKYDVEECRQRKMTYASPLRVTLRLVVFDVKEDDKTQRDIRDVKEQEVYLGEIPLMTDNGSFVINGTERVIVSQLHRSPGVFFDHDSGKANTSGKLIYSARVIPYRGSWLDFEFDNKDLIYARIDRRRKFPATIILKALGYSVEELFDFFYNAVQVRVEKNGTIFSELKIDQMIGQKLIADIKNNKGKVIVQAGRRVTRAVAKLVQSAKVNKIELKRENLNGAVFARPVLDRQTGEIIADTNSEMNSDIFDRSLSAGERAFNLVFFDGMTVGPYLCNTLLVDKVSTKEEALIEIFKRMKPGEPPTLEVAEKYFQNLFFNPEMYDLGYVGRLKINHRFDSFKESPIDFGVLRKQDITRVVRTLIDLKNGKGQVDDIDHLGNRRVRSVGELLENQYRIGLVRMERVVRDRMNLQDKETVMPQDLINAKSLNSVIKEFFGSSQLSQFMDQTNPLAEITHKRRLSALGPGGLTRDRAGFEVRDVHPTHYGRICPIETPEGPNIGLIASLATFARVDQYGFIETPYRSIQKNKVTRQTRYVSALEEQKHCIAQADPSFDQFSNEQNLTVRANGEYKTVKKSNVSLMDVSPGQLVSVASSLIPFLEHDDANRALMGSNMQRQAVPLVKAKAPLVGTGMEYLVARDSGTSIVCKNDGIVEAVDAGRIVVRRIGKDGKPGASVDIYNLIKYQKTNQNTCFNQRPIVNEGDRVERYDVIADGPATDLGELALGQNVLVAFTPFEGYNFEDSILISERLIKDDVYTSIHIEEFECVARDTKLGKEEITADIVNVGEEALKNLDTSGIIQVGSKVKPGDILVGKITPKGETQISPEKKLLLAIFGEKAGEVRDTSLRAPSGVTGTVIDTQVYSREGVEKDDRLRDIIQEKKKKAQKDFDLEKNIIQNNAFDKMKEILIGQKTSDIFLNDDASKELLKKRQVIQEKDLDAIPFELISNIPLENDASADQLTRAADSARQQMDAIELIHKDKVDCLSKGDDMPPGVIKMIKVYVAVKRKLQVGDKFAGRHGNKGVISKILPEEDMPYLADGTPVDMVLNPLGVPSRMNIGQILETHLGWAAHSLGLELQKHIDQFHPQKAKKDLKEVFLSDSQISKKIDKLNETEAKKVIDSLKNGVHLATPVFDGAKEKDIQALFEKARLPRSGQTVLFHGGTGEPFRMPVTVGVMYMLKLHHLVEEKIHARSTGPYSLVSQQPLGGKAQFGGQRLGEMEVWAIEAYGAAYCLQEFLTVKSDDVAGRTRMYESIVKGENVLEPGIPEAFNVLVKELQSLALDVELIESDLLTERPKTAPAQ